MVIDTSPPNNTTKSITIIKPGQISRKRPTIITTGRFGVGVIITTRTGNSDWKTQNLLTARKIIITIIARLTVRTTFPTIPRTYKKLITATPTVPPRRIYFLSHY